MAMVSEVKAGGGSFAMRVQYDTSSSERILTPGHMVYPKVSQKPVCHLSNGNTCGRLSSTLLTASCDGQQQFSWEQLLC